MSSGRRFQSTPPRGKRLGLVSFDRRHLVSIHAPAREATAWYPRCAAARGVVSIHAPAREATRYKEQELAEEQAFQSTPPRGKRLPAVGLALAYQVVSIHAPVREATRLRQAADDWEQFQSTPPRGKRRWRSTSTRSARTRFNPRPRAGSDPKPCAGLPPLGFNPRPRAGSDAAPARAHRGAPLKFQSTPPRGKRRARAPSPGAARCSVSIHAPAREATRPAAGRRPSSSRPVSIHAPAREATLSR